MSRIHDALKKAELEKAAGLVPQSEGDRGKRREESPGSRASTLGEDKSSRRTSRAVREDPVKAGLLKALDENCRHCTWKPNPMVTLFVQGKNHAAGAEEFRSLRSRLYLTRAQQPLRKLLVTSALPKEGKTFTSLNLSFVMAQQPECRVLLIDADLRLPQLYQVLGAPRSPGLADYLEGGVDEFSVIQRSPAPNFYFIPSGNAVSNPSELIGNGRLKVLLTRLLPAFEWIILDSPPVIPVFNSRLIAGLCDGALMLVRAGKTPHDLAKKACQEFQDKGLLGVVLNQVRVHSHYGYYYGTSDGTSKKQ